MASNVPLEQLKRLPSVEAKTIAYIDTARSHKSTNAAWLVASGFQVYLRFRRVLDDSTPDGYAEELVIAAVEAPERKRSNGWFWRYCQLCIAITRDNLALENVVNERLASSLEKKGFSLENGNYIFRKKAGNPLGFTIPLSNNGL